MKKLNLVLTAKWFDMIASGIKKEEYREIKQFFIKRFCQDRLSCDSSEDYPDCHAPDSENICPMCINSDYGDIHEWWKHNLSCDEDPIYDEVYFHRGYTKTTMVFKIEDITIGEGRKEWGAPDGDVFIIKLGDRLV